MNKNPKDTEMNKLIGNNIKKHRENLGITQKKLGNILGVSLQQIQKYEKGVNRISALYLQKISFYMDIPISMFFLDKVFWSENYKYNNYFEWRRKWNATKI